MCSATGGIISNVVVNANWLTSSRQTLAVGGKTAQFSKPATLGTCVFRVLQFPVAWIVLGPQYSSASSTDTKCTL
jgi:hypothetical protein